MQESNGLPCFARVMRGDNAAALQICLRVAHSQRLGGVDMSATKSSEVFSLALQVSDQHDPANQNDEGGGVSLLMHTAE
jgi:hypothetical protein